MKVAFNKATLSDGVGVGGVLCGANGEQSQFKIRLSHLSVGTWLYDGITAVGCSFDPSRIGIFPSKFTSAGGRLQKKTVGIFASEVVQVVNGILVLRREEILFCCRHGFGGESLVDFGCHIGGL